MKAIVLAASVALVGSASVASAANYPVKPIKPFSIGFAPGGPSDVMARILTKKMEDIIKQPFVVENRAGAGGSLAGAAVARAAPDGYTILMATGSLLAINPSLYKNYLGYNPEKDFEPITLIGTSDQRSLQPSIVSGKIARGIIAYAKSNPGKLSFGSGGNGTPAHLAGELLKIEAKIDMTHVPFRGTGPALQAVIGGHVPLAYNPPPPLIPHIKAGTIHPIAITTLERTAALPDLPTIAELRVSRLRRDDLARLRAAGRRAERSDSGASPHYGRSAPRCASPQGADRSRRRCRRQQPGAAACLYQGGDPQMGRHRQDVRGQGRLRCGELLPAGDPAGAYPERHKFGMFGDHAACAADSRHRGRSQLRPAHGS